MELKDYLRIFRRHWLLFFFIVGLVLGVYFFFERVQEEKFREYEARTQILYMPDSYREIVAEGPTRFRRPHTMNESTFFALIQGDSMLERVARSLSGEQPLEGAGPEFRDAGHAGAWKDAKLDTVRRNLRVEPLVGTQIVTFHTTAATRDQAVALANTMAEAVRIYARNFFRQEVKESISYLLEEKGKAERERQTAQEDLVRIKDRVGGGFQRLEEEAHVLVGSIANLEQRLLELQTQIYRAQQQQELLRQSAQDELLVSLPDPPAPPDGPLLSQLRSRLVALRIDVVLMAGQMTEDHPQVVAKKRELKEVETLLTEAGREATKTAEAEYRHATEQTVTLAQRERAQRLAKDVAELALEVRLLSKEQEQAERLLTERRVKLDVVSTSREEYETQRGVVVAAADKIRSLDESLKDLELKSQSAPEAVSIEMRATSERANVKARASETFSAFFFIALFGLVLATGTIYLVDYLDDRVRTSYDVKRYLNLPVPITIPYSREADQLLTKQGPTSAMAEVFNSFGALLLRILDGPDKQVVLIASTHPEEGKSTVVANTAIALARMGKRVVAVDCDMRRPTLHRLFELEAGMGLADYLEGRAQARAELDKAVSETPPATRSTAQAGAPALERVLRPTAVPRLWVLPAGAQPASPISLLESPAMDELLAALRSRVDVIILDSPPILSTADPLVLAPDADAVFLVVEEGLTMKHELTWAKRLLVDVGANIAGVLLNKVRAEGREYYAYGQYEIEKVGKEG